MVLGLDRYGIFHFNLKIKKRHTLLSITHIDINSNISLVDIHLEDL